MKIKYRIVVAVAAVFLLNSISTSVIANTAGSECRVASKNAQFMTNTSTIYPNVNDIEINYGTATVRSGKGTAVVICPFDPVTANSSGVWVYFRNGSNTEEFSCQLRVYSLDRKSYRASSVIINPRDTYTQKNTLFAVKIKPTGSFGNPRTTGKKYSSLMVGHSYLKCLLPEPTSGNITEIAHYGTINVFDMPTCIEQSNSSYTCR